MANEWKTKNSVLWYVGSFILRFNSRCDGLLFRIWKHPYVYDFSNQEIIIKSIQNIGFTKEKSANLKTWLTFFQWVDQRRHCTQNTNYSNYKSFPRQTLRRTVLYSKWSKPWSVLHINYISITRIAIERICWSHIEDCFCPRPLKMGFHLLFIYCSFRAIHWLSKIPYAPRHPFRKHMHAEEK